MIVLAVLLAPIAFGLVGMGIGWAYGLTTEERRPRWDT